MAYVIREVGQEMGRYDSLASALRKVAKIVARNEADGESNYILILDDTRPVNYQTVVQIHQEGAKSKAHTVEVLARASERVAREDCHQCDGDGFSGDPLGGNCPRRGGGGKELSR